MPSSHAWNRDFTWEPHTGPLHVVTTEQAKAYDEDGLFVLDDAIDPSTLAVVSAAIGPFEEKTTEFLRTQPDGKLLIAGAEAITFTTHLVTRSPVLRAFAGSPL